MVSAKREPSLSKVLQDPGVPSLTTHAYGGTRMGDNLETNVVDRWGFS